MKRFSWGLGIFGKGSLDLVLGWLGDWLRGGMGDDLVVFISDLPKVGT
jgi:hypothetical protein